MNVGFVGLGMMGNPIATRLLNAGYPLFVYNRTKQKAEELVTKGAHWCESPASVAEHSEIVFSMLSTPEALKETALGEKGILRDLKRGSVHIDMSTVAPSLTRELEERYRKQECSFLHSPVLGSIPQATDGTLLLFVGGNQTPYERVEPLLKILGKQIWKFDRAEQASHLKLLCNSFIAGMITTLGQALQYAEKADVNPRTLLEVIGQSQLNSPMYQTKGTSILNGNFTPRFFLEHMLKDVDLILAAAEELGTPLPALKVTQQLYKQAYEQGLGKEDYSAVVKMLKK